MDGNTYGPNSASIVFQLVCGFNIVNAKSAPVTYDNLARFVTRVRLGDVTLSTVRPVKQAAH